MVNVTRRAGIAGLALTALAPASRALAQESATVRVVGPANDGMKPVWYGVRSGIFTRYRLNVETVTVNSGAAALATVVGGSAEIAYVNTVAIFQAHLRGIPVAAVAPSALIISEKPIAAMVVLKDSAIRSARDMNGKTLSSPSLRDLNAAAALAWVDKFGGDSKTVRVIEIPAATALPALEAGRVDVASIFEPALTQALAGGKTRLLGHQYDAVADRFQATVFAGVSSYIDRNRDVMSRFARAMHESILYTNSHLAETVELVASFTNVAPDVVAQSVRYVDAEYLEPRFIQPLLDLSVKYGLIDRGFAAEELISPVALKPPRRR